MSGMEPMGERDRDGRLAAESPEPALPEPDQPEPNQDGMQWHRFSKATVLGAALQLWAFAAIIAFAIAQQSIESDGFSDLIETVIDFGLVWLWRIIGILAALGIVTVIGATVRWRFMGFALAQDGIHLRSGILV